MRDKKYYIALGDFERKIIINCLSVKNNILSRRARKNSPHMASSAWSRVASCIAILAAKSNMPGKDTAQISERIGQPKPFLKNSLLSQPL